MYRSEQNRDLGAYRDTIETTYEHTISEMNSSNSSERKFFQNIIHPEDLFSIECCYG